MLVKDAMSTGVVGIKEDTLLRSVVEQMVWRNVTTMPVVDDENNITGVLTIRDVMLPLYPNFGDYIHDNVHARDFEEMENSYKKVLEKKVVDVMTVKPMTVSADEPILKAASYMGLRNLRRIPVADNGKLVGIISVSDINTALFINKS
ncbi:MAG: CBS domain-containing protein [Mariprofundaceae bacterium]|nr:CBS domain-containing protein [Mariprofundaceae bacterium]